MTQCTLVCFSVRLLDLQDNNNKVNHLQIRAVIPKFSKNKATAGTLVSVLITTNEKLTRGEYLIEKTDYLDQMPCMKGVHMDVKRNNNSTPF